MAFDNFIGEDETPLTSHNPKWKTVAVSTGAEGVLRASNFALNIHNTNAFYAFNDGQPLNQSSVIVVDKNKSLVGGGQIFVLCRANPSRPILQTGYTLTYRYSPFENGISTVQISGETPVSTGLRNANPFKLELRVTSFINEFTENKVLLEAILNEDILTSAIQPDAHTDGYPGIGGAWGHGDVYSARIKSWTDVGTPIPPIPLPPVPSPENPFPVATPEWVEGDPITVGAFKIVGLTISDLAASYKLGDARGTNRAKVPFNLFSSDQYPNMNPDISGEVIPGCIGKLKKIKAFQINVEASLFKLADHGLVSIDTPYDKDGNILTFGAVDLVSGEFTLTDWDGETEVTCDCNGGNDNPVDAVGFILTSEDVGAGIPLSGLDTSNTSRGFGSTGTRVEYTYGTDSFTGDTVWKYPIALYMNDSKEVKSWVQIVSAASFQVVFTGPTGLWQTKKWKPSQSDGLQKILNNQVMGKPKIEFSTSAIKTRFFVRYDKDHSNDSYATVTAKSERLRRLRGFNVHSSEVKELPLSALHGARDWAQKQVQFRGKPTKIVALTVTKEHTLLEQNDYVILDYPSMGINEEVLEVISVTSKPGMDSVNLRLQNVRGMEDGPGFYTDGNPQFPASLGGGNAYPWDEAWTDAQKKYARENLAYYHGTNGWIDENNDPKESYRATIYT
jgi:hypothetical protein